MTNFKLEYQKARLNVEAKSALGLALKAFKRTPQTSDIVRIRVIGPKERDRWVALGWTFEAQDVSAHGFWVRQYELSKSRSAVYLDLRAAALV